MFVDLSKYLSRFGVKYIDIWETDIYAPSILINWIVLETNSAQRILAVLLVLVSTLCSDSVKPNLFIDECFEIYHKQ